MTALRPHPILLPLAWVYGGAMAVRNRCYGSGIFTVRRLDVPVISVGNMTAGGSGKTPLVAFIARHLQSMGRTVGIVSRGYGRRSAGPVIVSRGDSILVGAATGGDEAVMLARQVPGIRMVVAERRVEAAEIAVRELGADVLVMDDGFQHRALHRDLDILVVDGRHDVRREPMLPAGYRREPLSGIRRASIVGIAKLDDPSAVATVAAGFQTWGQMTVFGFRMKPSLPIELESGNPGGEVQGAKAFLFSGIGDPAGFERTVRGLACEVVGVRAFADHHIFTAGDVRSVLDEASRAGASWIVTTEKDAVRLRTEELLAVIRVGAVPMLSLPVDAELFVGADLLKRAIATTIAGETP